MHRPKHKEITLAILPCQRLVSPASLRSRLHRTAPALLAVAALWVLFGTASAALPLTSSLPRTAATSSSALLQLTLRGQLGGGTHAVAVAHGIAYVGVGPRVVSYDVSDSQHPRMVGQSEVLAHIVQGVAADDERVVVTASGTSTPPSYVYVLDATDPQRLPVLGQYEDNQFFGVGALAIRAGYAYIALDDAPWLEVLDATDRRSPKVVNTLDLPLGFMPGLPGPRMVVEGDRLYVGSGTIGVAVIDVSAPSQPVIEGTMWPPVDSQSDIAVLGHYAYLAGGREVQIVDVSDPANMAAAGRFSLDDDFPRQQARLEYLAQADGRLVGLAVVDEQARVLTFDTADALNPRVKGAAALPLACASIRPAEEMTLILADGLAFVPAVYSGLHVIDVRDPTSPRRTATLSGLGSVDDAALGGDRVYAAACGGRLWVIDVRDPVTPVPVADVLVAEGAELDRVALGGGHVFALDVAARTLYAIDVSGRVPIVVGRTELTIGPSQERVGGLVVKDDHAFAAVADQLVIVDVGDLARPQVVARVPSPGARAIALAGHFAYIGPKDGGDGTAEVHVVDVANPTSPVDLGSVAVAQPRSTSLAVFGNRLFVLGTEYSTALDLSEEEVPASPRRVEMAALGAASVGSVLATDYGEGLNINDLEDLDSPSASGLPLATSLWQTSWTPAGREGLLASARAEAGLFLLGWDTGEPTGDDGRRAWLPLVCDR
jgi:hypothetical protein